MLGNLRSPFDLRNVADPSPSSEHHVCSKTGAPVPAASSSRFLRPKLTEAATSARCRDSRLLPGHIITTHTLLTTPSKSGLKTERV